MASGDTIPNFTDPFVMPSDLAYTGGDNSGFTGSSTLQDVQPGSPVQLDTSYNSDNVVSLTDFMNEMDNPTAAQTLSGVSDPPFMSAAKSTPTPNAGDPNANTWAGLTGLAKFGASIAGLFSAQPVVAGSQPRQYSPAGGPLQPGAASGTNTVILLVVVGALILLLLRAED